MSNLSLDNIGSLKHSTKNLTAAAHLGGVKAALAFLAELKLPKGLEALVVAVGDYPGFDEVGLTGAISCYFWESETTGYYYYAGVNLSESFIDATYRPMRLENPAIILGVLRHTSGNQFRDMQITRILAPPKISEEVSVEFHDKLKYFRQIALEDVAA